MLFPSVVSTKTTYVGCFKCEVDGNWAVGVGPHTHRGWRRRSPAFLLLSSALFGRFSVRVLLKAEAAASLHHRQAVKGRLHTHTHTEVDRAVQLYAALLCTAAAQESFLLYCLFSLMVDGLISRVEVSGKKPNYERQKCARKELHQE